MDDRDGLDRLRRRSVRIGVAAVAVFVLALVLIYATLTWGFWHSMN